MKKILLSFLALLTSCLTLHAGPTEGEDAAKETLSRIDTQIAQEQQSGDVEKEGLARWQKMVTLKNYSLTEEQLTEAEIQMEWFFEHSQWDHYYRTWQLKANAMCALGKLQPALQETQRMLSDAKERGNKLGRAMAYKQIGIIYLNMKQTEPAVEALQHYAQLMKEEGSDINSLSNIYYRIAKAYDYDKSYAKELQVTNEWREFLLDRVGKQDKPEIRECYNSCYLARAASFIGLKRLEDAGMALDTAGHHAHLINTALSLHHYYKMQARYHLALGDAANALVYTDSVRMTTSEKDDHAEEVRAQALIALGRGVEAAQIYQQLYHEKDSVFSHETRQHLDELNTLFQIDELKTEQQKTKLRYTLFAAAFIVLALLLFLLYGWRTTVKQKKVNEQLRIANDRARVSSKMKTEFIRNITHEIRTPLNILSGFTQVLTTPGTDLSESEKADIQRRVRENTDYITELVDRMLELSDISSVAVIECNDQFDAQEFVEKAIERSRINLYTRPGNADSAVTFDFPDRQMAASVKLLTNRIFAVRALAQLLENAVKFTHEGSITLRMTYTDSKVCFAVEDTGIGIAADQRENIFEEFVQIDAFSFGTGIGLPLARSIARRMGGDLWLDTGYTHGSRFLLELKRLVMLFALLFLPSHLLTLSPLFAQYEKLGGVYYAYPVTQTGLAEAPEGYEPFYISHYGRHGSRWLPDDERYIWVNKQFEDSRRLTKLGKNLRKRLAKVWKNAKGNGGQLTPLGGRQHRGIARRMYQNFPQLFTEEALLTAHSSTVNRCRTSMENFVSELRAQNPSIRIDPVTLGEDMKWIAYKSPEQRAFENSLSFPLPISTDRFINALFTDASHLSMADREKLLSELHTIASDMQDVELKVSLYDIFTEEEMEAVYRNNNKRMTLQNGDMILNEGIAARSAISLWQRIEADADAAIARGGVGADLRFGHDTNLYRLLTLMGVGLSWRVKGEGWRENTYDLMDVILPMAANLQMIFYKSESDDEILVQLLHNEKSIGFKSWKELKAQVNRRIHDLEHLRQLCALNTMVGTAPANTKTAGLFGKGSEEHGQTLPAVLSPNGQNFWTPQTRDTEKKCIAPYYYTDSLFQGIRNSHWIVGGCTQDYGSFTVAALTGKLRLKPEERATRFSHADEVSHPHYYAVRLPDEHLKIELTGASHAAMLRITPEQDGPVYVVVNHNSDEGEGSIGIVGKMVIGSNPVHRIYQGWGERAGFSGHFLLRFDDEILDSGKDSTHVWLTFQGKAHQPIVLQMASSFVDLAGAASNLFYHTEGRDFDRLAQSVAYEWIERLHTIDVEDADTARVNQFYGALYRCFFLPREMSDADGSYPRFASGTPQKNNSQLSILNSQFSKYYGDFSMWDTYRALHPLYTLIAPRETADMMQSLVTMYEEGGWLPIFPCWNSYTAAMIGDHCSVALADAYIKGIRSFDAEKAYEAMRKNAFETPVSFEDYKNGMGRRALNSYLTYGYIPLEDSVKEAFHQEEQTSRTLEYAFDDFAIAQMAEALGKMDDHHLLMARSDNWQNIINPKTGYCDGRHQNGRFENNTDFTHRKPWITEGAACHYTWYVPHNVEGLVKTLGGPQKFEAKLDSMFTEGRYWHGNEPCHQIAYLYDFIGKREKTIERVAHILDTEYNDTPGGLSGNDDAGQMSAWYVFSSLGFYPVCPATDRYMLSAPRFQKVTLNLLEGRKYIITPESLPKDRNYITQGEIIRGN